MTPARLADGFRQRSGSASGAGTSGSWARWANWALLTKLSPTSAWSTSVGGGILSTLGVVVGIAGPWAWLSSVAAGLVAPGAGYSYVRLAARYGEGGGASTFLREAQARQGAGSLSWVLIVGYVLTNAVCAATFGAYLGVAPDSGRSDASSAGGSA